MGVADGTRNPSDLNIDPEIMLELAELAYQGDVESNKPGIHVISKRWYPSKLPSILKVELDDAQQVDMYKHQLQREKQDFLYQLKMKN